MSEVIATVTTLADGTMAPVIGYQVPSGTVAPNSNLVTPTEFDCHERAKRDPNQPEMCTTTTTSTTTTVVTIPRELTVGLHSSLSLDQISPIFVKPTTHTKPLAIVKSSSNLEVIGAGLMRTGTTSLKRALELLYHSPCYHMSEVAFKHKQSHIRMWIQALTRRPTSHSQLASGHAPGMPFEKMLQHLYQGYTTAVDYPTCAFYKELMAMFPNAKVILTVKDPYEWVQSCRVTTLSPILVGRLSWGDRLYYWLRGIKNLPELHKLMFSQTLGTTFNELTDFELMKAYQEWNDQVIATVPADRLLIYNVKDGWDPLCEFLDRPQPNGITKFPHLNKRADMSKVFSIWVLDNRKVNHVFRISG
ncbi:unnamed protein product [Echinostoma caproni]|uniref:Sulfotransfer_1 domain-containing protein n=1 Tax=Echinostoma caproni TaxID=27848 RepID=A0A183A8B0_9TREM|nr:unnamed protein product [Echinostoma caproni]